MQKREEGRERMGGGGGGKREKISFILSFCGCESVNALQLDNYEQLACVLCEKIQNASLL